VPQSSPNLSKFDHLVVLMLENRSFDNLLGYLYESDKPQQFIGCGRDTVFRGVAGQPGLCNPDASDPPQKICVAKAPYTTFAQMANPSPDPGEGYKHVNNQVYGRSDVPLDTSQLPVPAPMNGFVRDYMDAIRAEGVEPTSGHYSVIMNCFTPEAVPVLNGLAKAFAVSDEWFCSVPSQTFCNRSFFHSGQSHGNVYNSNYIKWQLNDNRTIFDLLSAKLGPNSDWRVYWYPHDLVCMTRIIHRTLEDAKYDRNFRELDPELHSFKDDCEKGDLPAYTFIQPRLIFNHNDMHPPIFLNPFVDSSILAGELLIHEVYEAVSTGPKWQRTLLVITFDEHGGCYDHWPPPLGATPPVANPNYELEEGFGFDRFGVRVPAVFVSPYVAPGTVIRAGGNVPFDHTSMIKTICQRWEIEGLTDRDRAAPDFGEVLSLPLDRPRRDRPTFQARQYEPIPEPDAYKGVLSVLQKDILGLAALKKKVERPELGKIGEAVDWLRRII
jgi:phospholipase C